ncbi:MAG: CapA family protein [bacterium]
MTARSRRALVWTGRLALLLLGSACFWAVAWTLYNPSVPLAAPRIIHRPRRGPDVTVLLAGDTAPHDKAVPRVRAKGYTYPYSATAELFRQADVSFFNLEAPVTRHPNKFFPYKFYYHQVDPAAVPAWKDLGVDVVSLANNHVKDRRDQGLLDTLAHLRKAGIEVVGAGASEPLARRPVIVDVEGTRIGFLAYLQDWWFYNLYHDLFALQGRPGCARFLRADVTEDVRRLKPLVDVVVVSVHWGRTYSSVNPQQRQNAELLASLGVDVVVGHHNHELQPAEWIGRTLVLYSLGNYAFGSLGHTSLRAGLLARLRIQPRTKTARGRLRSVELLPIVIQNRIVRFRPRRIRRRELPYLNTFLKQSRKAGTRITIRGTTLEILPK